MDRFYIGAYWHNRKEKLEPIIHKSVEFLGMLLKIDEQFTRWYESGNSRKQALEKEIEIKYDFLDKMFRKRIKKGDLNDESYSKIGFSISGWSGHKNEESSSFSISSGVESEYINNNCIINLPNEGQAKERLLNVQKLKDILELMVRVWQPDYAVVQSKKLRDTIGEKNYLGWMTYYDKRFNTPSMNPPFIVESVNNFGNLIYFAPPFDVNDKLQVELLKRLKAELRKK